MLNCSTLYEKQLISITMNFTKCKCNPIQNISKQIFVIILGLLWFVCLFFWGCFCFCFFNYYFSCFFGITQTFILPNIASLLTNTHPLYDSFIVALAFLETFIQTCKSTEKYQVMTYNCYSGWTMDFIWLVLFLLTSLTSLLRHFCCLFFFQVANSVE